MTNKITNTAGGLWRTDDGDKILYVDGRLNGYMYHIGRYNKAKAKAESIQQVLATGGVSSIRYKDPALAKVTWQHNGNGLDYALLIADRDAAEDAATLELVKLRPVNKWLASLDNDALDFIVDHYEFGYSITVCGQMHGMKRDTALRHWKQILLTWRDDGNYIPYADIAQNKNVAQNVL